MGQVLDVVVSPIAGLVAPKKTEESHSIGSVVKIYMDADVLHSSVFIVAYALGLNIEVDFVKDEKTESGDDFLKINSEGTLPLSRLTSGNYLTTISMQLMVLCDACPAAGMGYPEGSFERVYLFELLLWLDDMQKMVEYLHEPEVSGNPTLRAFFVKQLEDALVHFDRHILNKKCKYIQGHVTVADVFFFTIFKATYPLNLSSKVQESCQLLQGYVKRLHLLPKIVGAEQLLSKLEKERGITKNSSPSPGRQSIRASIGSGSGQRNSVTAKRRVSTTQEDLRF